jgi:alpha-1,2-mannosyltransferase
LPLAKAVWAVGNVALFSWCLVRGYHHVGRWTPVVLAVAAVAQPLQSNFQHLNINLVLLALVVLAIADLEQGREVRAALWIGVATALKGYPGAIFLYFLVRGRWRPLVAGVTAAVGLTLLVMVPAGFAGAANVSDYVHLALTAQSTQALAGQSIGGLVARLGGNVATAVILDLLAVAAVAAVLWRGRATSEPTYEVGMTAVLAVLLAPLDRLHYYVLALPAWTDLFSRPAPARGWRRTAWLGVLGVAALLTSGMLSHISSALPTVLRVIRQNTYNFGAIILLIVLVARRAVLSPPPQPSPASRPT